MINLALTEPNKQAVYILVFFSPHSFSSKGISEASVSEKNWLKKKNKIVTPSPAFLRNLNA